MPRVNNFPRQKNEFFVPRLSTGAARSLQPSEHPSPPSDGHTFQKLPGIYVSLSSALGHRTFTSFLFITDLINPQKDKTISHDTAQALGRMNGGRFRFKALQVKSHGHTYNALKLVDQQGDRMAEVAYWLPQGGHIDVPAHPSTSDPKIILTPGFSGCSLAADLLNDGHTLRIRHVQGGHEDQEYNNVHDHGFGLVGAMEYKNYAYHVDNTKHKFIEHVTASAFIQFTGIEWVIKYQRIQNIPSIKSASFTNKGATVETIFSEKTQIVSNAEAELKIPKH